MRRSERHHLKENPVAEFLTDLAGGLRGRSRSVLYGVAAVVVAFAVAGGFYGWQQYRQGQAGDLLAQAMTVVQAQVVPPVEPAPVVVSAAPETEESADAEDPETDSESGVTPDAGAATPPPPIEPWVQPAGTYPSLAAKFEEAVPMLLAVAEEFPTTVSGISARYQAAAALAVLERPAEAGEQYERVIADAGDGIYVRMATLGLSEVRLLAGDYAAAIALLEGETAVVASDLPVDAVLMRLGRAYELAGQNGDALAAYTRVLEEFPGSLYFTDAEREAESLRNAGA